MNNSKKQHQQIESGAPPLTGGALLHLDGQCFTGPQGMLAVALSESAVRGVLRSATPTHWLLPLEASWVANLLPSLEGEIFWISNRPPRAVVGALNESIRGAWLEGTRAVLDVGDAERQLWIRQMPPSSFLVPYLARLVVSEWTGETRSESVIDAHWLNAPSTSYQFAA